MAYKELSTHTFKQQLDRASGLNLLTGNYTWPHIDLGKYRPLRCPTER